jgi:hemolysin III
MSDIAPRYYTTREEIANSITHGVGIVLSIAGLSVLTAFASVFGTVWHIVSCSIYGGTQILLYTSSTLYHSVTHPRMKAVFRKLDHSAIFLLIAGTYTPFTLVNLRGPWGWTIFGVIWALAVIGILLQTFFMRQKTIWTAIPYIAMGWIAIIAFKPLFESIALGGIALVVAGGLAYTIGTFFYVGKRIPFNHAIWHLFVLAGSAFHFFAILFYVIPLAG